jgi:hypothetical protein
MIEETGSEIFPTFQNASRHCRIPVTSPFLISKQLESFSGGFAPTPPKRYPAAPEGRPGGGLTTLHEDLELKKNRAED